MVGKKTTERGESLALDCLISFIRICLECIILMRFKTTGGQRGGGGSRRGREAAGVERYHKSLPTCSLASCFRHIIEQGLGFHRSILPGTRLLLAHPPRAVLQGETAPKSIDERWNISRCDVRYRAAGVYIQQRFQLVRGAACPGTMISRIRRRAASPASAARSRAASPATAAARRQDVIRDRRDSRDRRAPPSPAIAASPATAASRRRPRSPRLP